MAIDPVDGRQLARWNLPEGLYPHSMDRFDDDSLAVMVQTQPCPLAPVYPWQLVLPPSGGSGCFSSLPRRPPDAGIALRSRRLVWRPLPGIRWCWRLRKTAPRWLLARVAATPPAR